MKWLMKIWEKIKVFMKKVMIHSRLSNINPIEANIIDCLLAEGKSVDFIMEFIFTTRLPAKISDLKNLLKANGYSDEEIENIIKKYFSDLKSEKTSADIFEKIKQENYPKQ